jgi:ketopantoate reductase
MKILIYGAGPLGSLFAVRLVEAGHQVSVLARGQRLKDLQEYGCVIEDSATGEQEVARVQVVESLEPNDAYDLIMVVMRKNHTMDILPVLAVNTATPTVLFMMNNAGGSGELVAALGQERVMMGFPLPGGERRGHVMRVLTADESKTWTLPIGEVDGQETERTRQVASILASMKGYEVEIRNDMDAWLKYHVAAVGGLAAAMYAAGADIERMGRTRDAMVLGVRAMKEGIRSLREAGVPPSPASMRVIEWLPEPILVGILRKASTTHMLKVGGEAHARAARDEMQYLMQELIGFLHAAGVETPVLEQLLPYCDPQTEPFEEGREVIPLDWRSLQIAGLTALAAVLLAVSVRRKVGRS